MVQRRSYQTERGRECVAVVEREVGGWGVGDVSSSSLTSTLTSQKAICQSLCCTIEGWRRATSN